MLQVKASYKVSPEAKKPPAKKKVVKKKVVKKKVVKKKVVKKKVRWCWCLGFVGYAVAVETCFDADILLCSPR